MLAFNSKVVFGMIFSFLGDMLDSGDLEKSLPSLSRQLF